MYSGDVEYVMEFFWKIIWLTDSGMFFFEELLLIVFLLLCCGKYSFGFSFSSAEIWD